VLPDFAADGGAIPPGFLDFAGKPAHRQTSHLKANLDAMTAKLYSCEYIDE
jgi:hypothetical protein